MESEDAGDEVSDSRSDRWVLDDPGGDRAGPAAASAAQGQVGYVSFFRVRFYEEVF